MIEPDLSLQKPLEDYIDYIERLNSRSVGLITNLAEPSLSFQDPYNMIRGVDAAEKLLQHRLKIFERARYKISDFTWGRREKTAYIFWSFIYTPYKKTLSRHAPEQQIIEGVSEVFFSLEGRVESHSEFWGAHDGFDLQAYRKIDL